VVRFDCTAKFKNKKVDGQLIAQQQFKSSPAKATLFATAKKLFKANSAQLPPDNTRQPKIVKVGPNALDQSVVTTDFFGLDISDTTTEGAGLLVVMTSGPR
jgi:hypothetical protein